MILLFVKCSVLLALLMLGGCGHYQAGTGTELPFSRIYVAPVVNRSHAPQAQPLLTQHLAERFQKVPGLKLVNTPDEADAHLHVTLIDFSRALAVTESDDTVRALAYDVVLEADVTLKRRDGEPFFEDRLVRTRQQVFAVGSYRDAEFNAIEPLTRELSTRIRNTVISTW